MGHGSQTDDSPTGYVGWTEQLPRALLENLQREMK